MNRDLAVLVDPETGQGLDLNGGELVSADGLRRYPIVRGIPRFVPEDNYAADFGRQWNRFRVTQLDSNTGTTITLDRLRRCLGGSLAAVRGRKVLEAGCGAGRFTEILLAEAAVVHAFDYSDAVDANAANHGGHAALTLAQADIRAMPFCRAAYDVVVCLGVLQHTPDPERSICCLYEMLKPGGLLVLDHYLFRWRNVLPPPIGVAAVVYRSIALRLAPERRFDFVRRMVDFWFPVHWRWRESRFMQRLLRRVSPVSFYYPGLGLKSREQYYEWALLDTHDGTTDHYKHHRTVAQIRQVLRSLGAEAVQVSTGGNGVEASCRRPLSDGETHV